MSATVCAVMATISIMEECDVENWRPERWPFVYVGGNLIITSSCTWGVGKLLGQKGKWWKTMIGAGVGGIAGSVIIMFDEKDRQLNDLLWLIVLSSTALGSVVGFNFKGGKMSRKYLFIILIYLLCAIFRSQLFLQNSG